MANNNDEDEAKVNPQENEGVVVDDGNHDNEEEDEEDWQDQALAECSSDDEDEEIFHDDRMALTAQEREWALAIKCAIEEDPELEPLNDFQYAQLALVDQDNVEAAKERSQQWVAFRQEYKIVDSADCARRYLEKLVDMFPRHIISFTYSKREGRYVIILDAAAFNTHALSASDGSFQTWFIAYYYLHDAASPDLTAIRQGIVSIGECEGFDWTKHVTFGIYKQFWEELGTVYPIQYHLLKFFHTGVFINMLVSMVRRFLPRDIRERIEMGARFDRHLGSIYLTPTLQEGNQRNLNNLEHSLRQRYINEKRFRL